MQTKYQTFTEQQYYTCIEHTFNKHSEIFEYNQNAFINFLWRINTTLSHSSFNWEILGSTNCVQLKRFHGQLAHSLTVLTCILTTKHQQRWKMYAKISAQLTWLLMLVWGIKSGTSLKNKSKSQHDLCCECRIHNRQATPSQNLMHYVQHIDPLQQIRMWLNSKVKKIYKKRAAKPHPLQLEIA